MSSNQSSIHEQNQVKHYSKTTGRIQYKPNQKYLASISSDTYRKRKQLHIQEQIHHHQDSKKSKSNSDDGAGNKEERNELLTQIEWIHQRNSSSQYQLFVKDILPYVQSLPEILHYLSNIVSCLNLHLYDDSSTTNTSSKQLLHPASNDILHLYSVLSKILRTELHAYNAQIFQHVTLWMEKCGKDLHYKIVETIFRTFSYMIQYDAKLTFVEEDGEERWFEDWCINLICHSRLVIRKLSTECITPLIHSSHRNGDDTIIRLVQAIRQRFDEPGCYGKKRHSVLHGTSLLLLNATKGIKGHLHSKGCSFVFQPFLQLLVSSPARVIKSEMGEIERVKEDLLEDIALLYMKELCAFVAQEYFLDIWKELIACFNTILLAKNESSSNHNSKKSFFKLMNICTCYKKGILLSSPTNYNYLYKFFFLSLKREYKQTLMRGEERFIIQLVSTFYNLSLKRDKKEEKSMTAFLLEILDDCSRIDSSIQMDVVPILEHLFQNIIPMVHESTYRYEVLTKCLDLLSQLVDDKKDDCIHLLHILLSSYNHQMHKNSIFVLDEDCFISSSSVQSKLLHLCMKEEAHGDDTEGLMKRMHCIPFLVSCKVKKEDKKKKQLTKLCKQVWRWYHESITTTHYNTKEKLRDDTIVVQLSLLIEGLSILISTNSSFQDDTTDWLHSIIIQQIKQQSTIISISSLRAVSFYIEALSLLKRKDAIHDFFLKSLDDTNVLEVLLPNLQHSSHYVRLYTLQILQYLPLQYSIVNHDALDLRDDLDEEYTSTTDSTPTTQSSRSSMNVYSILYDLECLPISYQNDRKFQCALLQIQQYILSKNCPVLYRDGILHYVLGLFHVKLSTVWDMARKIVRELFGCYSESREDFWLILRMKLESCFIGTLKNAPLDEEDENSNNKTGNGDDDEEEEDYRRNYWKKYTSWEEKKGDNSNFIALQQNPNTQEEEAVPKYISTDAITIFQNVWSVLHAPASLSSNQYSFLVNHFLSFLKYVHFSNRTDENVVDPDQCEIMALLSKMDVIPNNDVLELNLQARPSTVTNTKGKKQYGTILQLRAILHVLTYMKRPKALEQYPTLCEIYKRFLSHNDQHIVSYSTRCIFNHTKNIISSTHVETITSLVATTTCLELRDVLLNYDIICSNRKERKEVLSIFIRVLFGRISSHHTTKRRKIQESPGRVRHVILTFLIKHLSSEEHDELGLWMYYMIRIFLPASDLHSMQTTEDDVSTMLLQKVCKDEVITLHNVKHVPMSKIKGFLNLLGDVISQFGCHLKQCYVDYFFKILLVLLEFTTVKVVDHDTDVEMEEEDDEEEKIKEEDENEGDDEIKKEEEHEATTSSSPSSQLSSIRSLIYSRLLDLFLQFGTQQDSISTFLTHKPQFWKILQPALIQLPTTVYNCVDNIVTTTSATNNKPPMLLLLIKGISSLEPLLPFLTSDVIKVIIHCFDTKCRNPAIISTCLDFISNLIFLDDEEDTRIMHEDDSNIGMQLLGPYVPFLLSQFTKRFEQFSSSNGTNTTHWKENNSVKQEQKRQLQILCYISESCFLNHPQFQQDNNNEDWITTLDSLCHLLLPFLKFPMGNPRSNTYYEDGFFLPILKVFQNLLPKLLSNNNSSFFIPMAKLLGPNKTNSGFVPLSLRLEIIRVLSTISIATSIDNEDDESVNTIYQKVVLANLRSLNAKNLIQVDECCYDVEKVITRLTNLGKQQSWLDMTTDTSGCKQLIPLLYHLLHCLYDNDSVIHRGSFQALRTFIQVASAQAQEKQEGIAKNNPWINVLSTTLLPCIKQGIGTKENVMTRRYFILLLRDVLQQLHFLQKEDYLHLDLHILINDVDQDLDFFLNLTHVQVHRRVKAFSRLRKILISPSSPTISQTSLYNILLALIKHPIYESKDSAYVQEAILTLGSLSHHFAWKKYEVTLSNALANVTRFPDRESQMIGMVCSILNGFHFKATEPQEVTDIAALSDRDIVAKKEGNSKVKIEEEKGVDGKDGIVSIKSSRQDLNNPQGDLIWRVVNNRLLPLITQLLTKETTDKSGAKQTTIRSPVTLALFKLYQKVLSPSQFQLKFQHLLLQICTCLQHKDESIRMTASKTLANIASEMEDLQHLSLIIQQLALTLKEGYRLHVRISALHAVLFSISKVYKTPTITEGTVPPLDQCIPAIMDLIQQDLFGMASETKDRSKVKESFGAKTFDIIEILSKMIVFDPSSSLSSIHCMTSPLFERLLKPNNSKMMHKIRECFHRVVIGLSKNTTCEVDKVMAFVYATVSPFIKSALEINPNLVDMENEDGDDEHHSILVSGGSKARKNNIEPKKNTTMNWLPSTMNTFQTGKEARYDKKTKTRKVSKVIDGDNALKQTGCKGRHKSSKPLDKNPATVHAVSFGLSLLHVNLKKQTSDYWISMDKETRDLADSFIPMLTDCVAHCSENEVILLALRCLNLLLQRSSIISDILPSASTAIPTLAKYTLELLINSGGTTARHEMTQSCFKTLTLLMTINADGKLFEEEQMEAIISILHAAVLDTTLDQQQLCHAIFGFIKVITAQKYKSAQFYDMMETILKVSVQSQLDTLREQSSRIFQQFLVSYPMAKKRLDHHMQQVLSNIQYIYENGRKSALQLLSNLLQTFPLPLVEEYAQSVCFLPLVLRLVNEEAMVCRQMIAKDCLGVIFQRVSVQKMAILWDYNTRWFTSSDDSTGSSVSPLKRTSAQLFGLIIDHRPNFVQRADRAIDLFNTLATTMIDLNKDTNPNDDADWEYSYFCLVCFEKLYKLCPEKLHPSVSQQNGNNSHDIAVWTSILKSLVHNHPWISLVASRIIQFHISLFRPIDLKLKAEDVIVSSCFVTAIPGSLYEIARNTCYLFNTSNDVILKQEEFVPLAAKNLSWVLQAMYYHPHLCFKDGSSENQDNDDITTTKPNTMKNRSIHWVLVRLAGIAGKENSKREAVFKCFAAFASGCNDIISPYLQTILEPVNRCISEHEHKQQQQNSQAMAKTSDDYKTVELAKDLLQIIEENCDTQQFLQAYATVKSKATGKRMLRKQNVAANSVKDSKSHAEGKLKKQVDETKRKKRRLEEKKQKKTLL